MADKKFFTLNTTRKTITLDTKVKPTELDKEAVQMYVNAGYIIRYKSESRAAAARERAKKTGFGAKKKETANTTK